MFLGHVTHRFAMPSPLVPLDLDLGRIRGGMHLVAARSALEIPRVRAVADRLAREIERVTRLERRARPAAPERRARPPRG